MKKWGKLFFCCFCVVFLLLNGCTKEEGHKKTVDPKWTVEQETPNAEETPAKPEVSSRQEEPNEQETPTEQETPHEIDYDWELADDLRKAYQGLICELEKDGELSYSLVDLNGDKMPELVADVLGYRMSLYTYVDGEVCTLIDGWPYGAMGNHGYEYVPGENVIRNYNADLAGAIMWIGYWKITEDHQVEEYYPEGLSMWMFQDLNDNYFMDEGEYIENPDGSYEMYFYYGDQELTEEEFDTYLIEGDYQRLKGRYSAGEMIEWLSL